jgi:hypothetical protein
MKKFVLLAFLIAMVLISCSDNSGNTGNADVQTTTTSVEDTPETTAETVNLPDMNFDGREFTFILRVTPDDWTADDVVAAEQNGAPINDAVYTRNVYIEEKYNLKISGLEAPINHSIYNPVKNSILAADNSFDVIAAYGHDSARFAQDGFIHDLTTIQYLDLTKPWWNPTLSETLTINNRQFYATGDISYVDNFGVRCFFFNKDIVNDLNLENPYELVNENKWVMSKLFEMAVIGTQDLNGDGVMNTEDRYGIQAQSSLGAILTFASGVSITKKDSTDTPYVAVDQPEQLGILDSLKTYMGGNPNIHYSDDWLNTQTRFAENKVLFQAEVLLMIQSMRGAEVNIGIIPSPKYDESQENYIHYLDGWCENMYSIPVTAVDIDEIGFLLEAMAAKSVDTLTPAFYDVCLNGKYVRDEESSAMLDIIFGSYIMENAESYGWGSLFNTIQDALKTGKDVTSLIEANKAATQAAIEKTVATLNEQYQ